MIIGLVLVATLVALCIGLAFLLTKGRYEIHPRFAWLSFCFRICLWIALVLDQLLQLFRPSLLGDDLGVLIMVVIVTLLLYSLRNRYLTEIAERKEVTRLLAEEEAERAEIARLNAILMKRADALEEIRNGERW